MRNRKNSCIVLTDSINECQEITRPRKIRRDAIALLRIRELSTSLLIFG
jgi:hypothetical protein